MTDTESLIVLNLVPDIGSARLKSLLEIYGSASKIIASRAITSFSFENLKRELELCKKLKIKIITLNDEEYPEHLKNIYDPPLCLYVKGELSSLDNLAIAIVGSRRASFYGLSNAQKFAADLSDKGFTIVSGMARGIDTYAHRGALKQAGRTIAVLGSGFNHIYPAENKELAEKISHNGAVISEFPLDMPPKRENFPRRNRIISGLSLGVLVVEAAKNSGALITADCALEQGREVQLIQQGLCEKIVTSGDSSLGYLQILKGKSEPVAM